MKLPFHVIEMLKRKSGVDLRLPSDCEQLALDIEGKTGIRIGATTLKRLTGFAGDERTPHLSTLDVIARYLGYAHWRELAAIEGKGNSNFDVIDGEVRSADLSVGAEVEFTYLPDRMVRLQYLGDYRFRVIESLNSKLRVTDEVIIHFFILHHPLLALDVCREGVSLGQFTAGRISGLTSIVVLP